MEFCWEDDTTGCICGNECEPPKWVIDLWDDHEEQNRERIEE